MSLASRRRVRLASILSAAALSIVVLSTAISTPTASADEERNFWEERKNLQVLPKDIPAADLRGIMIGAAQGLGVRCWFCHVGEEGQDLATFDFASDDKGYKAIAREMIKMTMDINQGHMPKVAEITGHETPQVRCVTCHRGEAEPKIEGGEKDG